MTISVFSLTALDWAQYFKDHALPSGALPFWLEGLYKNRPVWERHISPKTLSSFRDKFSFDLPEVSQLLRSEDGTVKFQMRFQDQMEVETVLIPFPKRYTICLSTQVGCAMNCSFCFTGTQGLKRHLDTGEIVAQYLKAWEWLQAHVPGSIKPSIVFMGQGEPLHNGPMVKQAIEVFRDPLCVGVGESQMTLSTVGYLPGIKTLSSFPRINFALSLHSPFDHERDVLIPMNQRYPLDEVLLELDKLQDIKKQVITYEYLMIKDFNISERHADALTEKLKHRRAMVNLIAFNPFPGSQWQRPSAQEIEAFRGMLVARKIRVMVRTTKGDDILAACGQLKIKTMARNYGQQ